MKKIIKTTLFIFIFLISTLGVTSSSQAQDNSTIQSTQIEGEILRIDDYRLIIETPNKEIKELTVPTGVRIKKNTHDSEYKSLQPGDKVLLTQNSNGEVISLEATAAPLVDSGNIILPVLLLLLPLSILALILKMKSQRNFITTSRTPGTLSPRMKAKSVSNFQASLANEAVENLDKLKPRGFNPRKFIRTSGISI